MLALRHKTTACLLSLAIASSIAAAVIHTTANPFGGFFGLWGPDVSNQQSVGARFSPNSDYTLTQVKIWFMNNSDSVHPAVTVTLRTDQTSGSVSIPSNTILAEWNINIQALGWNPVQEIFVSTGGVGLHAGQKYWIVAQSNSSSGANAVWNYASIGNTFSATTLQNGITWQPGGSGAALTLTVEGNLGLPIPADINHDGLVNGNDLAAVLSAWGTCANCPADINQDGQIDGIDLATLLSAWTG